MLTNLKTKIKQQEKHNIIAKIVMKIYRLFKKILRFITSRKYRSLVKMKFFHSKRAQQTTCYTAMDRYPNEFAAAKEYFDSINKTDIRILSYGCCTGEEVVTLRQYFPEATIVGAEINADSLRICKKRKLDNKIVFIKSIPKKIAKYGPYDMVLAMAVLERTPQYVQNNGITDLSNIYPYEKYDKQVIELDSYLKKDGLFLCSYTHYFLPDSTVGKKYNVYGNCGFKGQIFDTHSKLKSSDKAFPDMFIKSKLQG